MLNLKKIFTQASWQILGKASASIATLIVLSSVARIYGEESTGIFTLATTYLATFYLFADFGFNAFVLKKIAISDNLEDEWRKLFGLRIIWAVALIVLSLIFLPLFPFATSVFFYAVLFGCFDILASSVFTTNNLVFQSKLRYDLSAISIFTGRILGLGVFLSLLSTKPPVFGLIFLYLLGGIFASVISTFFVVNLFKKFQIKFSIAYAKDVFKNSWPLALVLILNVIYFRVDSFMIAFYRSTSDAGIYNVAYSIFQTTLVLPTFIMNAYYPMMLRSFRGIRQVALGLLTISFCGTVLTILFAPFITGIITGGGFYGSSQALQILSLSFPAFFLSSLMMWVFVTKGKNKEMISIFTSGLLINISLNLIFIPKYSFFAASWITVICEYFILFFQIFIIWRVFKK
jgi:O-antigen/teichoic acid export membrane protein